MKERNTILNAIEPDVPKASPRQEVTLYTPMANENTPGVVKPDGEQFIVDADGTLHVQEEYITKISDITSKNDEETGNTIVTVHLSNGDSKDFVVKKGDTGLPYIVRTTITNYNDNNDGMIQIPLNELSRTPVIDDIIFTVMQSGDKSWIGLLDVINTEYGIDKLQVLCSIDTVVETTGKQGPQGVGIASIVFDKTVETGSQYKITLTNGNTSTFVAPFGPQGITGDTGAGIQSITFDKVVATGYQYKITLTNGSTSTFIAPTGAKGEPFKIEHFYSSIAEMNADADNVSFGEFALILSANPSDDDYGKLYVKKATYFDFVVDMSIQGAIGLTGPAALVITQRVQTSEIPYSNDIVKFSEVSFNRKPNDTDVLTYITYVQVSDDKFNSYLTYAVRMPEEDVTDDSGNVSYAFLINNVDKINADDASSLTIQLGMEGFVQSNRVIFEVQDAPSYISNRKNLQKFLISAYLPIVGTLDDTLPVNITFGDTTYNLYNYLSGGDTIVTIGDLMPVASYSHETGYFFTCELIFLQNSDYVGFAIIPPTFTAKQLERIIEDSDTIVTDLTEDGTKLNIHLSGTVVNKLARTLVEPMTATENLIVGINEQGTQDNLKLGGTLKKVNNTLNVAEENLHGIRYDQSQTLTDNQKAQARSNIGAGASSFSGSYNDLANKPKVNTDNSASLTPENAEILDTDGIQLHKISKTGKLADAIDDDTHKTVTLVEKTKWNGIDNKLDKNNGTATGTTTMEYVVANGIRLNNMIETSGDEDYFIVSDAQGNMKKREVNEVLSDIGGSSVQIYDVMAHDVNFSSNGSSIPVVTETTNAADKTVKNVSFVENIEYIQIKNLSGGMSLNSATNIKLHNYLKTLVYHLDGGFLESVPKFRFYMNNPTVEISYCTPIDEDGMYIYIINYDDGIGIMYRFVYYYSSSAIYSDGNQNIYNLINTKYTKPSTGIPLTDLNISIRQSISKIPTTYVTRSPTKQTYTVTSSGADKNFMAMIGDRGLFEILDSAGTAIATFSSCIVVGQFVYGAGHVFYTKIVGTAATNNDISIGNSKTVKFTLRGSNSSSSAGVSMLTLY